MIEGLYRVEFQTRLGTGCGVVHLAEGKLHGGDSAMYYVGTYRISDDTFDAEVDVNAHSRIPGNFSMLGVDSATLSLSGAIGQDSIVTLGTAHQAPGMSFRAKLSRLA